jgi:hypothetical protein
MNDQASSRRPPARPSATVLRAIFWGVGILDVANGLWMLVAPESWYYHLPAGVPDTGPLNHHFVRDIGAAFLTIGAVFCVTARRASSHRGVVLAAALFYLLHAAVHLLDLMTGHLPPHHWLVDLPGVFLPAAILTVLCLPRWWRPER